MLPPGEGPERDGPAPEDEAEAGDSQVVDGGVFQRGQVAEDAEDSEPGDEGEERVRGRDHGGVQEGRLVADAVGACGRE